ncbi:MAG: hypothetical protein R6U78_17625 [Bacteroidales bacterium]
MHRAIIMLMVGALMVSCNLSDQKEGTGSAISQEDKIVSATIEELLSEPAVYRDQRVAVSGMVTHVCRHGGQKCFILAGDGQTQLRVVTGGEINEFETSLEGSTVAFTGVFRIEDAAQSAKLVEDYESQEHHTGDMPHSEAEQASYYIEAKDFKEVTP